MQQVKLFKGVETGVDTLEQELNAWLEESGAKVIQITGNIAPQSVAPDSRGGALGASAFAASDILIVVLYETPTP